MRKITIILLVLTMLLPLCACGATEQQNPAPVDAGKAENSTQTNETVVAGGETVEPARTAEGKATTAFNFDIFSNNSRLAD